MSKEGIAKVGYRKLLNAVATVAGPAAAKRLEARYRFGRKLNLKNPKTLADKVSWIELNTENPLATTCTDKYAVREYIAQRGLGDILIPLCGGPWTEAGDIDIDALPDAFVMKAAHGCGMNYICKDKLKLNKADFMACAEKWLKEDYPRACVEPHYKKIPHRLYAEKFIGGFDSGVVDYKFHCFNGTPQFILACSNREVSVKKNLYDLEWNPISGIKGHEKNDHELPCPELLGEMIAVSRVLAKDFEFVRVDLYSCEGKVLFGELTFSPAAGVFPNFTDDFVSHWGGTLQVSALEKATLAEL